MVEKTAAFRQRRAADTRRWLERLDRGAACYSVEIDRQLFDFFLLKADLASYQYSRAFAGLCSRYSTIADGALRRAQS
jgi:hypothetical protein